jgi:xanthine dehydrogenase YagS FAD-binding subunit
MNAFEFDAPTNTEAALSLLNQQAAQCVAGGTNLIDLMKERVARPALLIDINHLPLANIVLGSDNVLRIGALVRNSATAEHVLVRERYPLLRAAILAGASPQIRNMASIGGNLLQRTRCLYFYDAGVPCNKRQPGSGCPAATGLARQHAILGASDQCVATHPSDMCVALAALDAVVHAEGPRGRRAIPFGEFHRLPGDRPELDTTLEPDELITEIELSQGARFAAHSCYLKLRDRSSYAFALVSVAAALDLDQDGSIRCARIALGGVAAKPWRDARVEASLIGKQASGAVFAEAAAKMLADARGVGGATTGEGGSNAFKIPMARRAIRRALEMATAGITTNTGEDAARARGEQP